ncbi:uncharacterized protein BDV17DRAFT_251969 [Aspergillus undulatus]|uniref:uncharacterized protein n=1 Tax=Aspergillus undulatus TaxID=1810928 RepID=UPI003CCE486C
MACLTPVFLTSNLALSEMPTVKGFGIVRRRKEVFTVYHSPAYHESWKPGTPHVSCKGNVPTGHHPTRTITPPGD